MKTRTIHGQIENQREDGMVAAPCKVLISMVPEAGLEPAQGCPYRILSPARLPFHHSGTEVCEDIKIMRLQTVFKQSVSLSFALPSVPRSNLRYRTQPPIAHR